MRRKRIFLLVAVLSTSLFAILLAVSRTVVAQGPGRIRARAQIRSTLGPCNDCQPGVKGQILLVEDGPQQTFTVKLKSLPQIDLYIHVDTNSWYDGTNSPVIQVAPVNRNNSKEGNWFRKLSGTNGAPPEFQAIGIANLSDMSDLRSIVIASPGTTNILGGTNYEDCVQIVTNNQTIISCTTNVVGGTTQLFVNAFAWAPVPPLVANASGFSFNMKTKLQQPIIPPSPHAKGVLRLTYRGQSGASVMDIHATGLIQGQSYGLFVSDGGTNYAAGDFVLSPAGGIAKMHRDTKMGDSLPLQAASTADLTNRVFTIRDGTGNVHLIGSF